MQYTHKISKVNILAVQHSFILYDGAIISKLKRFQDTLQMMLGKRVNVDISDGLTVEVLNSERPIINIRSVMERVAEPKPCKLPIFLGVDNSGDGIFFDLAKAPHILIGGTTGSGKSVCINTIVACLTSMNSPQELDLSLIDVKKVEFAKFAKFPHLRQRIATETQDGIAIINQLVYEMDYRYDVLAHNSAVNLDDCPIFKMSVLIIDELADLMITGGQAVLKPLTRLLQKGRGAGIHCILATQNPTVKVIDGIIKANCPTRIAFKTASLVDSRVILDFKGAEKLTHKGEFLTVLPSGITQGQCALTTNEEIQKILNEYKKEF